MQTGESDDSVIAELQSEAVQLLQMCVCVCACVLQDIKEDKAKKERSEFF